MMRTRAVALFFGAVTLLGQSGIGPPVLGFVRDGAGALRPVFGTAGSFVLGDALAEGVVSAAFSGRVGLAKVAESLFAFDAAGRRLAETAAPPGPVRILFAAGGDQALVSLADGTPWVNWQDGAFRVVRRTRPNRRNDRDASVELTLPGGEHLTASDEEIILRQPDGTETRVPLAEPVLTMEQMGEGWVHVGQAERRTAVRVLDGRMEVYRLPEAGQ